MGTKEEELQKIINSNKCKNIKINGKNYWISKKVKDEIKKKHSTKEGGFLPLLGLIPGIIAGIGGAAGIASGIASTVSNSREAIKKQKEIQLLDGTLRDQQIAKQNVTTEKTGSETQGSGIYFKKYGSGLYLKPYQATSMHKYFKNNTDIPPELTKKFKNGFEVEVEVDGDGLYLKPYSHRAA